MSQDPIISHENKSEGLSKTVKLYDLCSKITIFSALRIMDLNEDGSKSGKPFIRGVQPFGVPGPHWKKSCLGPHINTQTLTKTDEEKKDFK